MSTSLQAIFFEIRTAYALANTTTLAFDSLRLAEGMGISRTLLLLSERLYLLEEKLKELVEAEEANAAKGSVQ